MFAERIIEITSDVNEYKIGKYLEIYEDKTGKLTYEEIQKDFYKKQFVLSQKDFPNFGVKKSTFWIRFKIKNESKNKEELFLTTFPTYSHINIWGNPKNGKPWEKKSGHMYLDSARDVNFREFTFRFDLEANQEIEIYTDVNSFFASTFPFKLYKHQSFYNMVKWETVFYSAWFGSMVLIILFNFFSWISFKDKNQLIILFFIVNFIGFTLAAEGIFEYNLITNFLHPFATLTFISFATFTRSYLKTKPNLPRIDKVLIFLNIISSIIFVFSSLLGPKHIFTMAVNLQNAVQNIILFIVGILSYKKEPTHARNFLIGFSFLLFSAFAYEMRVIGILPGNFLTLHGIQIAAFFFALFIYFSLIDEFIHSKKEKEKMQSNLLAIMEEKLIESQKVASLSTQLQELNHNLEDTVKIRTKELSETNQKLIEVNHLKNEFIGIVVHDMKTPLLGIKLLAESIPNKKLQKEKIQSLSVAIYKSSVYLLNSIQKMLNLNELEKGTVLKNTSRIDLRDLITQCISLIQPLANEKKIQLQETTKGNFFKLTINQIALEKIIENLLSNSVTHSPPASTIKIKLFGFSKNQKYKTSVGNTYYKIVIQNENTDFSAEKFNAILKKEEFHNPKNSFTTGKGLKITQSLVRSIQCKIDVKISKRYVVSTVFLSSNLHPTSR